MNESVVKLNGQKYLRNKIKLEWEKNKQNNGKMKNITKYSHHIREQWTIMELMMMVTLTHYPKIHNKFG